MAESSSYRISIISNGNDAVCFAKPLSFFRQLKYSVSDIIFTIIIEKEKRFFPLDDILFFINFVNEATDSIDEIKILENENIEIVLKNKINWAKACFTSIVIRYLWEGKYTKCQDNFYKIVEYFLNMCKYFPEIDKGILFSIANNVFLFYSQFNANTNHTLATFQGQKILSSEQIKNLLTDHIYSINLTFTNDNAHIKHELIKIYQKLPDELTESIYKEIINIFMSHKSN